MGWLPIAIVIALAMGFNYTNGFHDSANAIATSVSTRALTPRVALAMAAVANLLGAFFGKKVADTVGKGIIAAPHGSAGLVLVSAALLVLAACSKAPQRQMRPPVTVAVAPAKRATVPYDLDANGVVTPLQSAAVAAQVDGIVTDVLFQEGQEVAKGQVLFRIDPRPYQAAYQVAQANLERGDE